MLHFYCSTLLNDVFSHVNNVLKSRGHLNIKKTYSCGCDKNILIGGCYFAMLHVMILGPCYDTWYLFTYICLLLSILKQAREANQLICVYWAFVFHSVIFSSALCCYLSLHQRTLCVVLFLTSFLSALISGFNTHGKSVAFSTLFTLFSFDNA